MIFEIMISPRKNNIFHLGFFLLSDLVLNRPFPTCFVYILLFDIPWSYRDPVIFIFQQVRKDLFQNSIFLNYFWSVDRGYQKLKYRQNPSEMGDSGLDLIARKNPDDKYYFTWRNRNYEGMKKVPKFPPKVPFF